MRDNRTRIRPNDGDEFRPDDEGGLRAPPVRVAVQEPSATNRPDLTIQAGSGPAGVAVVTSDGTVVFLQPRRAR